MGGVQPKTNRIYEEHPGNIDVGEALGGCVTSGAVVFCGWFVCCILAEDGLGEQEKERQEDQGEMNVHDVCKVQMTD